jgi:hypothetical protein
MVTGGAQPCDLRHNSSGIRRVAGNAYRRPSVEGLSLRLREARTMVSVVLIAGFLNALPHLDIERVCGGARLDNSKDEYSICVETEQSALGTLRQNWARYPASVREECANAVRIAPESSYYELQTCIESQTDKNFPVRAP